MLGALPLIAHTYNGVKDISQHVYVAADSTEISKVCLSLNIPCILTRGDHENGTSRTLEAYQSLGDEFDYIVNVQGDEAFISQEVLHPLLEMLENMSPEAATLQAPLEGNPNPSNVYVVSDTNKRALYFSRNPIPVGRNTKPKRFEHIGVYAFTPSALKEYCSLSPTPLEQFEMLEQLRWLEHGKKWAVATAPYKPLSIDTPEDLEEAQKKLKK